MNRLIKGNKVDNLSKCKSPSICYPKILLWGNLGARLGGSNFTLARQSRCFCCHEWYGVAVECDYHQVKPAKPNRFCRSLQNSPQEVSRFCRLLSLVCSWIDRPFWGREGMRGWHLIDYQSCLMIFKSNLSVIYLY